MSTLGKGRHSDAEITKRYDRSFKTGIELVTWDILGMNWRLSLEGWWDISRKGEQCQQLPQCCVSPVLERSSKVIGQHGVEGLLD